MCLCVCVCVCEHPDPLAHTLAACRTHPFPHARKRAQQANGSELMVHDCAERYQRYGMSTSIITVLCPCAAVPRPPLPTAHLTAADCTEAEHSTTARIAHQATQAATDARAVRKGRQARHSLASAGAVLQQIGRMSISLARVYLFGVNLFGTRACLMLALGLLSRGAQCLQRRSGLLAPCAHVGGAHVGAECETDGWAHAHSLKLGGVYTSVSYEAPAHRLAVCVCARPCACACEWAG